MAAGVALRPRPTAAAIVASVILPPLGIFLARGLGLAFWIGTLLTVVGWLPGIVFALVAVLRPDFMPDR